MDDVLTNAVSGRCTHELSFKYRMHTPYLNIITDSYKIITSPFASVSRINHIIFFFNLTPADFQQHATKLYSDSIN